VPDAVAAVHSRLLPSICEGATPEAGASLSRRGMFDFPNSRLDSCCASWEQARRS